jgi:hypothetical protein
VAEIVHVIDHSAQALARLIGQYQGRPRLQAFIEAFSDRAQEIEDMFWDLLTKRLLDVATGVHLDNLGDIVGQNRQGLGDADYRQFIRARIKTNRANGKIEELIQIALLIFGSTERIGLREYYPHALTIEVNGVSVNAWIAFSQFLDVAKDAGVNLHFVFSKQSTANALRFSSVSGGVSLTTAQRPGSVHTIGTGGGKLAGEFGDT